MNRYADKKNENMYCFRSDVVSFLAGIVYGIIIEYIAFEYND